MLDAGAKMTVDTGLDHLHAIELPTPFPVGPVTVYLADGPGEPLTLVDTGPHTAEARSALEAGLAARGYALADLGRIVITHAHADHFGLAADLVDVSAAKVLAHPWNLSALGDYTNDRERRRAFYAQLLRQAAVPIETLAAVGRATGGVNHYAHPVAVDGSLDEGDVLRLSGREWQVLHTPGHAAGLICLVEPQSRSLLSSDHLLATISSNPVVEPPPPGQTERPRSLVLYRASLRRVADLGVARALSGHGPVIDDVARLVQRRLAMHQRRLGRVLKALSDGATTTWDVTQVMFPGRMPLDVFLAVSEVIGHLEVLEMEKKIVGEPDDGVIRWRLVED
jgi:glyoxylase-like metal-dependent hydrolase (beta-lactamase superfamily II)